MCTKDIHTDIMPWGSAHRGIINIMHMSPLTIHLSVLLPTTNLLIALIVHLNPVSLLQSHSTTIWNSIPQEILDLSVSLQILLKPAVLVLNLYMISTVTVMTCTPFTNTASLHCPCTRPYAIHDCHLYYLIVRN